jgi:hypothetical protein
VGSIRQGFFDRTLGRMNLRFPGLFGLFCGLMLLDFLVPDFIPFVDEVALTLLTALFALWKKRRTGSVMAAPGKEP